MALPAVSGCAGKKQAASRKDFKKEARELAKEAPGAIVKVVGGRFQVEDNRGRLVMTAQIQNANATLQPSDPSQGPVTIYQAHWTLYKEGKPSLWLDAPVATWQGGLLTAPRGARSASIDGRIALRGKTATWVARTDLLTVSTAGCELRDPGRPAVLAQGPRATWQNGLLTLPSGAIAHAADRSASMRADQVRWRARTHSLEAAGRVRMTRDRLAGAAERLTGDTALRQFRLSGGRPRVTIYNQPAPTVDRISSMPRPHPAFPIALAANIAAFAAAPAAPAAAARQRVTLSSGVMVEADQIYGVLPTEVHATGSVILTSPQGTLRADRVDGTQTRPAPGAGASRSPVQEARATGHVRITSQSNPGYPSQTGETMQATGAAGTYWPGTQKATLTGGVTVTMGSPQLQEPAVLTGSRADIDLGNRSATVVRAEAAPVTLRLRPKEPPAGSSSSSPVSGPVQLEADQLHVENGASRVTATGSPVLTSDQGTIHAEKIWFDIDPKIRDVTIVHAAGAVRIDAEDPQQGTFHATAREALMNRAQNTVVLTGNAEGSRLQPGNTAPDTFQGEKVTYNFKTGAFELGASHEARASVRFTPKPKAKRAESR
jgi:lipopolysaccharide transport protein LptA